MSPQELKELVKIEEIIAHYLTIVKSNNYNDMRCHCPFHHGDRNPSMSIHGTKQFFYCFGCHEAGDVFKFVSQIEKIEYAEAVRVVAQLAGISFAFNDLELLSEVSAFYHSQISSAQWFLDKRKIPEDIVKTFQLGYAGDNLYELSKEFSHQRADLVRLKLINPKYEGTNNEIFPSYFYNRLIFPIDTHLGIVSFSGRTLINDHKKFLNAHNNPYFNRNSAVYGLPSALQDSCSYDYIILVEGFLDKIRCFMRGYQNVVSILGSALTIDQGRLLKRFTKKVIFMYDGDDGGYQATKQSIETCLTIGLDFEIAIMPEGEDPDSYLIKNQDLGKIEYLDPLVFIEAEFTQSIMLKILDKADNIDNIDSKYFDAFKINREIYRKTSRVQIYRKFNISKLDKWDNICLLIDAFPALDQFLTDEDRTKIKESEQKKEIIQMIANQSNFFARVNNPTKILEEMRKQ